MVRSASSGKRNNSFSGMKRITGLCVAQQGSIPQTFANGCRKFAHARMRRRNHAPRGISFFCCLI